VTGIIPYDEGSVTICGHDLKTAELAAKNSFGFIPDNHAVFDGLTGREYVNFMANAYKVDKKRRDERLEKFCDMFNFAPYLDNQIKSYSHGMKQKIAIMGGIIHYPKLWILDEPLLGLDPKSIKEIQDFMTDYAAYGNSILFSSHILDTVDKMCSKILVIDGGECRGEYDLTAQKR
jgi:ABC-type multidrug transport system, ATPase component